MGSIKLDGVLFVAYSNDHSPCHVHDFTGDIEVIVDLRLNGSVALSKRNDAICPANAKRSDVKKILTVASLHFCN